MTKAQRKKWRDANKDKIAAQKARYRAKYPEKIAAENAKPRDRRAYYQANKPAFAERYERWAAANPELVRKYARESMRRHPERNAANAARRRAREAGVPHESVDRLAIYERERGICNLCRTPVERDDFTLDHVVPIAKGGPHIASNLAVAHKSCNSSKRAGGRRTPAIHRRASSGRAATSEAASSRGA